MDENDASDLASASGNPARTQDGAVESNRTSNPERSYSALSDDLKTEEEVDDSDSQNEDGPDERTILGRISPLWKAIDFYLGMLVKGAILVGSVFAFQQYTVARTEFRIGKTFEFVAAYERGIVSNARQNVRNALRPYGELLAENSLSEDEFKRVVMAFVEGDTGTPIANELDRIIDFFRGLRLCLEQGLCEKSVAKNYFYDQSVFYWSNFKPYIDERRSQNNDKFAEDLQWFVENAFDD